MLIIRICDIEPVLRTYFQDGVPLTSGMALRNSPKFLLPTSKVLIAFTVGIAGSEEFSGRWRQHEFKVTQYKLPRLDHFRVIMETTSAENPLTKFRLRLMELT
jgi:hypothetical protein